jgi:hypothetical protein
MGRLLCQEACRTGDARKSKGTGVFLAGRQRLPSPYLAACGPTTTSVPLSGRPLIWPLRDGKSKGTGVFLAGRQRLPSPYLAWLEAELAAWSSALRHGPPEDSARIQATLPHWKQGSDLAGIRAPEALARLPEPERKRWQALWALTDALLQQAAARPAP